MNIENPLKKSNFLKKSQKLLMMIFKNIKQVKLPKTAKVGKGFTIIVETDGKMPFAQIIVRHTDGWEWIVKGQHVVEGRL